MASLYEVVEAAIVKRLAEFLQGVRVEGFPDDGNELGKPAPIRRVLVGYQSSSFDVISEAPVTIKETLVYEVTVGVKGLRSHTGVYRILQSIKQALIGFLPIQAFNGRKMRPTGFSYKGVEEGIWYYSANFTFELTYGEPSGVPGIGPSDPSAELPELPDQITPVTLPNNITLTTGIWRSPVDGDRQDSILDTEYLLRS